MTMDAGRTPRLHLGLLLFAAPLPCSAEWRGFDSSIEWFLGPCIVAALLFIGMLFSPKTRRALVVPTILAVTCLLPFALFAIGVRIDVDIVGFMLIVDMPMFIAPWIFIFSALLALVLIFGSPASALLAAVRKYPKLNQ